MNWELNDRECPFCDGKRVIEEKRGFSLLYAIIGVVMAFLLMAFFGLEGSELILSLLGFLAGFIGSNHSIFFCKDCKKEWTN